LRIFDIARLILEMRGNQWLDTEELESLQSEKLSRLFRYASVNVPYYRKLSGIRIGGLSDLHLLPVLSKKSLREDPGSLTSTEFDKSVLTPHFTSGSSGVQVMVYSSPGDSAYGIALECHQMLENGLSVFDTQARISHFTTLPNLLQRAGIMRCLYLPVQNGEKELISGIRKSKSRVLCAYPSVVRLLSIANDGLNLKAIFTSGEVLRDGVRKMAQESFGCPVRDRYGTMDSSWIAWECERGSYHVHSDHVIVEIVDENGVPLPEGNTGRILVTPLWRRAMPIMRYDVGDRGSLGGKCSCGRGLHVLKSIEGRDDDFITLPSGRIRSARSINLLDDITSVLSYQIVQERADLFVVRFVPAGSGLPAKDRLEIRKRIVAGCLGETVGVEFEQHARIRGAAGKIRAVISKVD
jgi:phenylacetate-CoA ligase